MNRSFGVRAASALAMALTTALLLSTLAVAQYDEDDRYSQGSSDQASQYGYQVGFRDGYSKGRHEGRENDPNDINSWALQNATHGYQLWMGPVQYFRVGYQDGYLNGFRSGYQAVNGVSEDEDSGGYYHQSYETQYDER